MIKNNKARRRRGWEWESHSFLITFVVRVTLIIDSGRTKKLRNEKLLDVSNKRRLTSMDGGLEKLLKEFQ